MKKYLPKHIKKERAWGYLFVAAPFVQFIVFGLIPVTFSLIASFSNWNMMSKVKWVGLKNFQEMFADYKFWQALGNTFYYYLGIPVGMFIALLLAMIMCKDTRANKVFRVIYYLPAISSVIAISILWSWIYNTEYGLLNLALKQIGIMGPNWLGDPKYIKLSLIIMGIWGGLGPSVIMFIAALKNIPKTFYEAAEIDGANTIQSFVFITLPMLRPILFYLLIIGFIVNMQTFGNIYIMIPGGGAEYSGASIVFYLWQKGFGNFEFGYASAVAWVLAIITFVATLIQFKIRKKDEDI